MTWQPDYRYPLQRLVALAGVDSVGALSHLVPLNASDRKRGFVSAKVADRLACALGFDPYQCWPELLDDAIADLERECAAPDCPVRFIPPPRQPYKRYCTRNCKARVGERARYHSDPGLRERKLAWQREYDRRRREAA